jgi:PAS domain S-box-containing protein
MATPLRVLLVEDDPDDAESILRELRRGGYQPDWLRVQTAAGLRAALAAREWDAITSDWVMPQFDAPAALRLLADAAVDVPVIIVSGQVGEEFAVTAMKAGAHDFVSKNRLARLVPAIDRELREVEARRARRAAEAAARQTTERLRHFVEHTPAPVAMLDRDLRYVAYSRRWVTDFRLGDEPLIGRSHDEVFPEMPAHWQAAAHRCLAGAVESGEDAIVGRDGHTDWVRWQMRPWNDDDGRIGGLMILSELFTERKRAEEAAEAHRALVDHALQGLAIIQDNRIVFANRAFEMISGTPLGELHDYPLFDWIDTYVHPDDRAAIRAGIASWQPGNAEVRRREFRVRERSGRERWVTTLTSELVYRGRLATQVLFADTSEQRRAEDALHALNAELEHRVRERTAALEAAAHELEAFSSSVSHDLRAPLRVIDGFTQAVLEDCADLLPAHATAHLQRVRAAAERMRTLIDQLLALSRALHVELHREPLDLSALAREVAADLAATDGTHRVAVRVMEGMTAAGDAALMRSVIANLLGNAWKFSRTRAEPIVEFGRRTVDGREAFYVRDNGIGFDPRDRDRLFRPFERLHGNGVEGHGIGLATVQRIIDRHGGRVWAEGAPEHGATFYFTLG